MTLGVSEEKQYVPKNLKDADLLFAGECNRERSAFATRRESALDDSLPDSKADSTQSVSDPTKPQSAELEKNSEKENQ